MSHTMIAVSCGFHDSRTTFVAPSSPRVCREKLKPPLSALFESAPRTAIDSDEIETIKTTNTLVATALVIAKPSNLNKCAPLQPSAVPLCNVKADGEGFNPM